MALAALAGIMVGWRSAGVAATAIRLFQENNCPKISGRRTEQITVGRKKRAENVPNQAILPRLSGFHALYAAYRRSASELASQFWDDYFSGTP